MNVISNLTSDKYVKICKANELAEVQLEYLNDDTIVEDGKFSQK